MPGRDARGTPDGASPRRRRPHASAPTDFAVGVLSPRDAAELATLKQQIQRHAGICCEGYKERVLRRRIAVRMRARGVHTYAAYAAVLEGDPDEYHRLLDVVTINVSKFFRNASTWAHLRDVVVPHLFRMETPAINVWSAGVAAGEEAYSIAILLLQHAEKTEQRIERFHILGTDIDPQALTQARAGEYSSFAFTEMSDATRTRWFEGPGRNRVKPEVRALVRFARLDLMTDAFPTGQHLIICRNVLIYFERNVQERLFHQFQASLLHGGWLQLGKVETLVGSATGLFQSVSARERLFRRS